MTTVQYGIFPECVKSASRRTLKNSRFIIASSEPLCKSPVYKGLSSIALFPTMKRLEKKDSDDIENEAE